MEKQFHSQIGLAGGLLLIASGLYSVLKKVTLKAIPDKKSGLESSYLFLNGFLVNSLNPLAIFYWLAIASNATTLGVQNHTQITIFFVCIWLTLIIVDFFKIIFAKKLKNSLNHKSLTILHRALGVVVLVLGVLLLVRTGCGFRVLGFLEDRASPYSSTCHPFRASVPIINKALKG